MEIKFIQFEVGNRGDIFLTISIRISNQQVYIICLIFVIGTIVFYTILMWNFVRVAMLMLQCYNFGINFQKYQLRKQ